MITKIPGFCFVQAQAAMLRICMGMSLFGFACHAHAENPQEGIFASGYDLLSVKFGHSENRLQPAYRFSANFGQLDSNGNQSGSFGILNSIRLPGFIRPEKGSIWSTSIRWHMDAAGARASFSPRLQLQSDETLIVLKPVDHSAWMLWRRALD
jgi:hypothetical protein